MKKQLLGLAGMLALATAAQAQSYPLVEISDIQTVTAANLAACNDAPARVGDTVTVRGVVLNPGGIAQSASGRQIWIRSFNGSGPFQSIGIRFGGGNNPTTPTDLLTVVAGDTLEITGKIEEYNGTSPTAPTNDGETQINPLIDGVRNIGDDTGPAPAPTQLANLGILNDNQRLNNLETGEAYEGDFVKIDNVTVVAVTSFSGGARYSFTIQDAAGNRGEVSDRFLAARTQGGFVPPAVGDQFTSISGIVIHSKNRCQGTSGNNRGYEINPFSASHYARGASSPSIGAISRLPGQACSRQNTTFTATITDDGSIASASLFYAIGETGAFTQLPLTASGSIYSASIPGQADGTFVRYYLSATDNAGNVSLMPNTAPATPLFFVSRCGGPTIRDIQYTPFTDGNSGYKGQLIDSLRGVVVSSVNDLGQVFIQQEGQTEWGGLWLSGGTTLATLNIGDRVRVAGTVEENFNVTRVNLSSGSVVRESTGAPLAAIDVDPSVVSTYNFAQNEKYEGMLVRTIRTSGPLYVVDTNVAGNPQTQNFGEFRLGADPMDPSSGVVVMTGNQAGSNYSSLNVSYINGPRWASRLNVAPIIITPGMDFASVTGIIYYGFNVLMTLPRTTEDMPRATPVAPLAAAAGTDKYTVAPNPVETAYTYITVNSAAASSASLNGTASTQGNGNGGGSSCGCTVWRGIYIWVRDNKGGLVPATGTDMGSSYRLNVGSYANGTYTITIHEPSTGYTETETLIVQ